MLFIALLVSMIMNALLCASHVDRRQYGKATFSAFIVVFCMFALAEMELRR